MRALSSPLVRQVRGQGLFAGIELDRADAHDACLAMLRHGILTKDTHGTVLRFAPPLVIRRAQIDVALEQIAAALRDLARR